MTDMFLTPDELIAMTGRKQSSAQAKGLTHLGVIYKIRADGSVLVLRAHVEQLLGAGIAPKAKAVPELMPNWAALAERQKPMPTKKEKK